VQNHSISEQATTKVNPLILSGIWRPSSYDTAGYGVSSVPASGFFLFALDVAMVPAQDHSIHSQAADFHGTLCENEDGGGQALATGWHDAT